jgi:hypothetical protein
MNNNSSKEMIPTSPTIQKLKLIKKRKTRSTSPQAIHMTSLKMSRKSSASSRMPVIDLSVSPKKKKKISSTPNGLVKKVETPTPTPKNGLMASKKAAAALVVEDPAAQVEIPQVHQQQVIKRPVGRPPKASQLEPTGPPAQPPRRPVGRPRKVPITNGLKPKHQQQQQQQQQQQPELLNKKKMKRPSVGERSQRCSKRLHDHTMKEWPYQPSPEPKENTDDNHKVAKIEVNIV